MEDLYEDCAGRVRGELLIGADFVADAPVALVLGDNLFNDHY